MHDVGLYLPDDSCSAFYTFAQEPRLPYRNTAINLVQDSACLLPEWNRRTLQRRQENMNLNSLAYELFHLQCSPPSAFA
jgi:hypothetical protein